MILGGSFVFSPKIFDALLPVSLQYFKFKLEMYRWFFVYCDLLWGMLIWIFNVVDSKRLDWTVPKVKCAWIIKNNVVPICSQMISIPKNFLKVPPWITWTTLFMQIKQKLTIRVEILKFSVVSDWQYRDGLHMIAIIFMTGNKYVSIKAY